MQTPEANVSRKGFPAIKLSMPGLTTKDSGAADFDNFRSRNSSFLDNQRRNEESQVILNVGRNQTFRHHSLALGSTVRHYQTLSDMPALPSKYSKIRDKLSPQQSSKLTMNKVPDMMDILK